MKEYEKENCIDTSRDIFSYENGIRVLSIEENDCVAVAPINRRTINIVNRPHGGVLFTLADVACGSLLTRHYQSDCVTMSSTIDFLAAADASAEELVAHSTIDRAGSRVAYCTCTICDSTGKLVAKSHSVWMILGKAQ